MYWLIGLLLLVPGIILTGIPLVLQNRIKNVRFSSGFLLMMFTQHIVFWIILSMLWWKM